VSRIDKALRRAAGAAGASGAVAPGPVDDSGPFVSAWGPAAERTDNVPSEPRPALAAHTEPSHAPPILTATPRADVTKLSLRSRERLAASRECDPALLEQFRRLAGTLHNAQAATGIRTVLVSSTNPNEGKTLTALNLAFVLSESYGRRVLLIDADLRRPSISEVVEVTGSVGLSAALKATSDQPLGVIPLTATLTLLPGGSPDPDPLSGLTSARMKRILDEAKASFDWVILDGPPVGPLADASLLTAMVEGTLFVIKAAHTSHAQATKAIERLGRDRILGVVLNGANPAGSEMYPDYYQAYGPGSGSQS
jgi:protein-tyrosine kinase